jgi:hypothetical protein
VAKDVDHSTSAGGGSADKLWNEYESAWTLYRGVLPVMAGEFMSITVEPAGPAGKGIEFRLHGESGDEVHQVKGGLSVGWSIADLKREKILQRFKEHLTGTSDRAVFFSVRPAVELDALRRKARVPADEWVGQQSAKDVITAKKLKEIWDVDDDELHGLLRRIEVRSMDDESLPEELKWRIESRVEGRAPDDVRNDLAKLLLKKMYVPLTAFDLWNAVRAAGGRPRHGGPDPAQSELVRGLASSYAATVDASRPDGLAYIERPEVARVAQLLTEQTGPRTVIVKGRAGSGKSTVCARVVELLQAQGIVVGALRLDPATPAATARELGAQEAIGFGEPVADVMRRAAAGHPCVLVIDQFDALSAAAGRGEAVKDGVKQTLEQVRAVPDLRLLIACRGHDLNEDRELRRLLGLKPAAVSEDTHLVEIGDLDANQVDAALAGLSIAGPSMSGQLRALLRNVFNLSLLAWILDDARQDPVVLIDLGSFHRQLDLLREYDVRLGNRLTSALGADGFAKVTQKIAAQMSQEGLLSIPVGFLAEVPTGRDALLHHGVLVESGKRVRFFHQAYFEFVFAQHHFSLRRTAMNLLRDDPQELVRRGQARMVLALEREQDRDGTYPADLRDVLTASSVRTHVRAAVLDWLTELEEPGDDEVALVVECATGASTVRRRARTVLWMPVWVRALHGGDFYGWVVEDLLGAAPDSGVAADAPEAHFGQLDRGDAWLLLEAAARCEPERTAKLCLPLAQARHISSAETWQVLRLVFLAGPGASTNVTDLFTTLTRTVRDQTLATSPQEPDEDDALAGGAMAQALASLFRHGGTDALHALVSRGVGQEAAAYGTWLQAADAVSIHLGAACAFDPKHHRILPEEETGLDTLQTLAERDPGATADVLVPFVLTQAQGAAYANGHGDVRSEAILRKDRVWVRALPGQHAYESEVLKAATTAVSLAARTQPIRARSLLAPVLDCDLHTIQNLIGAAYAQAAPELIDDALVWAARYGHRQLHSNFAAENRWAGVVAHVLDTGSAQQRRRAEELVTLPYAALDLTVPEEPAAREEDQAPRDQYRDRLVQEQYIILDEIARLLGPRLPVVLDERRTALALYMADHKLPWAPQYPDEFVSSVASPVRQGRAQQFSDDDWIEAITRIADTNATFAQHRPGAIGGAATFANVLETVAQTDPVRFAALLAHMAPPINPAYPAAVLRALSAVRSPMTGEQHAAVCDAIRTVHAWRVERHGMGLSQLVRTLAAEQVPNDVLEIIASLALNDPNPTSEVWKETSRTGTAHFGGNINDAGLNCVRGNALRTIGVLIQSAAAQPERISTLLPAVKGALKDEREQVRVMIPGTLLTLAVHDHDTAVALSRAWLEGASDTMLAADNLPQLAYRVSLEDLNLGIAITRRMLAASATHGRQSAGQLAVLLPAGEEEVERAARSSLLASALDDPASRHGVGVGLVQSVEELPADLSRPSMPDAPSGIGWALLLVLLDDPDDQVAYPIATSLGAQLQHVTKLAENYGTVISRLAHTRGFIGSGHQLLRGVHLGGLPIPDSAVHLCRVWFEPRRQEMEQPGAGARAAAQHLVPIVLSVYGGTRSPQHRTACLDLLDELIEAGVDEASRAADDAEPSA